MSHVSVASDAQRGFAPPGATSLVRATVAAAPYGPVRIAEPASALAAAVGRNVGSQGGLAFLLAELAALPSEDLPADVQAAATDILGATLDLDRPLGAGDLQTAIARSGLFLETDLATGGAPVEGDLKAALLRLSEALQASGASPDATPDPKAPPPPYPGGPLAAQAAALATAPAELSLSSKLDRIMRRAGAALSRQLLLQAASARRGSADTGARWLFELPTSGADGTSVTPFEVDRDASREGEAEGPIWRTRLCLDLGEGDPVHIQLALQGETVRVGLWAERAASAEALQTHQADLASLLQTEGLEPRIIIQTGKPPTTPPSAGAMLDRTA
jgi:hypothetical protein